MAIEKVTTVRFDTHTFQIGRINATAAQWVAQNLNSSDEAICRKINNYVFSVVKCVKERDGMTLPALPIWDNGYWLIPELELDLDLVLMNKIYRAVLDFNLTLFLKNLATEIKEKEDQEKLRMIQGTIQ